MKWTCNKNELINCVNIAQRAVSQKSTLSALEGLMIKTSDGAIKITGYDLEIGIECVMEAEIIRDGGIVLSAKTFSGIIRKLPAESVTVETDDNYKTVITCGQAEYVILGQSTEDFPELPIVEGTPAVSIPENMLKVMIRQSIFALSQNMEGKPVYTGALFEAGEGELKIISVDGFRLAIRKEKIDTAEKDGISFIIPGKTLNELIKILSDTDILCDITVTKKHTVIKTQECVIISRLIEGEFINYNQAVPDQKTISFVCSAKAFADSVERAALLISEKTKNPIKCKFCLNEIGINLSSPIGNFSDFVAMKTEDSKEETVVMGFNDKYLLDAIKGSEENEILVEIVGALSPLIIKPTEGDNFLYIVLPVRLREDE